MADAPETPGPLTPTTALMPVRFESAPEEETTTMQHWPPRKHIVVPLHREEVTGEPDLHGQYSPDFPDVDWVGFENQGGGFVPDEPLWTFSPKEQQELTSHG